MTTPAEKQVDVFKAGMSLANLVNYSNQLKRLCHCPVCTFVQRETKKWSVWCTESSGRNLQVLMDQRCYFYQRCNNLQAYILEEIFEIASEKRATDRDVTLIAHNLPKVFPAPEHVPESLFVASMTTAEIGTMPTGEYPTPSPSPPPAPAVLEKPPFGYSTPSPSLSQLFLCQIIKLFLRIIHE